MIRFEGKHLIKDVLIIDCVLYLILASQILILPLSKRFIIIDWEFQIFVFYFIGGLCAFGAMKFQNLVLSFINSWSFFVTFLIFSYIGILYNGPYDIFIAIITFLVIALNLFALGINLRGHWRELLGQRVFALTLLSLVILYLIYSVGSLIDYIFAGILGLVFLLILIPGFGTLLKFRNNVNRLFNFEFYRKLEWNSHLIAKIFVFILIMGLGIGTGVGSYYGFGYQVTIIAPESSTTISSYWGPPSLKLDTINSQIAITDNTTFTLSNTTLSIDPPNFHNGTLAYILSVQIPGNTTNFMNYSDGAQSYPNGTIILSQPIPNISNVNVTFRYVKNSKVFEYLALGNSTLIMNYHGDFINFPNQFHRITKTYLFQLLEYWKIKFYLDIYNGIEFPHVFNYLSSIPLGYQTLNWAYGKYTMFQGVSYDFESGKFNIAPGLPGGIAYEIGEMIGNETDLQEELQDTWYGLNEQNRTLFHDATQAYEDLYAYASNLGYKTYITLGKGEMMDALDGEIDYTRCPVDPFSKNPDVLYGLMCYNDNNKGDRGRFSVYRDCYNQIRQFGNQGRTILLGWIANGTRYYTDDEIGLKRYIYDCKIAQAAGMSEIFHAPIYRMQSKWGDEAVLRLHQALNEDPKEPIAIRFSPKNLDRDIMQDAVENLNELWLFIPVMSIILGRIILFGIPRAINLNPFFIKLKHKKIE